MSRFSTSEPLSEREAESLRSRVRSLERQLAETERVWSAGASARRHLERHRAAQSRVLELLATGHPLREVLQALVLMIESQAHGVIASVLLLDEDGCHLRHGAAPSLPLEYVRAIDGVAIGPTVGSCGTAAYRMERVIVEDILEDPLWADYRELANKHRLRACWSQPVLSSGGKVLGTFAMYYRSPCRPSEVERMLIDSAAHLAGVAIEQDRARVILHRERSLLQILMDNALDAIYFKDRESRFERVNRAQARMLGLNDPAEAVGRTDHEFFPSVTADEYRKDEVAIMTTGQPLLGKVEHNGRAGAERRWFSTTKVPYRGEDGEIAGTVGISRDITARVIDDRRQAFLLRELDHRVKNNLASVISIAEQTREASRSLDDFGPAFTGRLMSMAIAHEMLACSRWDGVGLQELVDRIIAPHRSDSTARFELAGEPIRLTTDAAPVLSMVLNELVTNAVKHGALSSSRGRVSISWRAGISGNGTPEVHLEWTERDGPAVAPRPQGGLGTSLIEEMLAYQLGGGARLDFRPDGLRCVLRAPLAPPSSEDSDGPA